MRKRRINTIESDSSGEELNGSLDALRIETSIKKAKTSEDNDSSLEESSCQDYIKNLRILHKILQNNHLLIAKEYVKGLSKSLPSILGLNIKKIGPISLPIQEYQAEKVINQSSVCKQGKNAYEIQASKITIENEEWQEKLNNLVYKIKDKLGCSDECVAKLEKLLLVKSGGSIKNHRDASKDKSVFGKLIVQLPSVFSGGCINVSINDDEKTFDFGQESRKASYHCHFVSFYSDLEYNISTVKNGYEMFLVYDLVWSNAKSLNYLFGREPIKMENNALESLVLEDMYMAIELNDNYSHKTKLGIKILEKNDKNIYKKIKKINDRLPEDKQFAFSLVRASVVASQLNRHPARKDWCRGGDDCDCGCVDKYEEDDDVTDSGQADDNDDDELSEKDTSDEDDIFEDDYSDVISEEEEEDDRNDVQIAVENEQVPKRNIDIRISEWLDSNGNKMFEKQTNYMSIFNKIIDPTNSEPFIDNLSDEEAWSTNGFIPFNQSYHKCFLAFWPKKYENRLFIKNDLESYIKLTYKQLICDMESNLDEAMQNIELIISELVKRSEYKLNSGLVYNICESLRYTQNEDLTKTFLNSVVFKKAYEKSDIIIFDSLVSLVMEFGEENLKSSFLGFMSSLDPIIILRNCALVKELLKKEKEELALECFQKTIILFMINNQNLILIQSQQMRENIIKDVFILLKLFVKADKFGWNEMLHLVKHLMLDASKINLEHNFEILDIIVDSDEYELTLTCVQKNILPSIHTRDDFEEISTRINLLLKRIMKAFKEQVIAENNIEEFLRNYLICLESKKIHYYSFIDFMLIDFIKNSQNESRSSRLYSLIKQHIDNLQTQINDIESWKMPNAKGNFVNQYPEIKAFLISNEKEFIFRKPYFSQKDYVSFAGSNGGNKNGYSLYIHAHEDFAVIEKREAIKRERRLFKPFLETEKNSLNNLLNLYK